MNTDEEAAFRMLIDYLELKKRYFPNYFLEKISTTKDPRKSHFFRMCYKAIMETRALGLPKEHLRFYVKAQLQILKIIEGNYPIGVECLVGPHAWKRWLVWWARYQKQRNITTNSEFQPTPDMLERIKTEIAASSAFLEKRKTTLKQASLSDLNRWIKNGAISVYFLASQPEGDKIASQLGIDISMHKNHLSPI